jgi:hypothetical protein
MYTAFPCSEYYELVRLPISLQTASLLDWLALPAKQLLGFSLVLFPSFPLRASIAAYLTLLPGADGASQVLNASLLACQALGPRQAFGNLTVTAL